MEENVQACQTLNHIIKHEGMHEHSTQRGKRALVQDQQSTTYHIGLFQSVSWSSYKCFNNLGQYQRGVVHPLPVNSERFPLENVHLGRF